VNRSTISNANKSEIIIADFQRGVLPAAQNSFSSGLMRFRRTRPSPLRS
jgi:hypothetical protein